MIPGRESSVGDANSRHQEPDASGRTGLRPSPCREKVSQRKCTPSNVAAVTTWSRSGGISGLRVEKSTLGHCYASGVRTPAAEAPKSPHRTWQPWRIRRLRGGFCRGSPYTPPHNLVGVSLFVVPSDSRANSPARSIEGHEGKKPSPAELPLNGIRAHRPRLRQPQRKGQTARQKRNLKWLSR